MSRPTRRAAVDTCSSRTGPSFAVGAGPYYYFDTTVAEGRDPRDYTDAHGLGVLTSASATWRSPGSRLSYQLRVEYAETRHNLDTVMVTAGLGYRLDWDNPRAPGALPSAGPHDDEVLVAVGQTIVNSLESQSALAKSIEYRHAFGPVLRGSIAWLSEGDARLIRRNGAILQAWLEPSFFNDRFTLGIGFGPYFAVDEYREDGDRHVLGILTTTASYNFSPRVVGRLSFHRTVTGNDRDSDVILLGLGWRF